PAAVFSRCFRAADPAQRRRFRSARLPFSQRGNASSAQNPLPYSRKPAARCCRTRQQCGAFAARNRWIVRQFRRRTLRRAVPTRPGAGPNRYFIVIPDGIGHGKSSKPSDGMHARFPHYEYEDMIEAQHRLVTEGLKIDHLQLVTGVSMGGMHTWMWGEEHPEFVDRLFPLVCMPIEIAGRNRLWRDFTMYLISSDPDYNGGEYKQEPPGVAETITMFDLIIDGPSHLQQIAPNRDRADALFARWTAHAAENRDATDLLYALNASRNYNPEPNLEKIQAHVVAVNAADDFINPPELGAMDKLIARVKHGKFVLIPVSAGAHGHGSGGDPALWKQYLAELMAEKGSDKQSAISDKQNPGAVWVRLLLTAYCLLLLSQLE